MDSSASSCKLKAFEVEDQHVTGIGVHERYCWMFLDGSRSQVKVSSLTLVSLHTHVSQEASISLFQRWTWNRVEPCSWNSDNNDLPELAQPEEDEIQGHLVWV